MDHFELIAPYSSTGDQPEAIAKLTEGVENGLQEQVLLGVTGSGKTFTMANVIANVNRPTLVLAHNKTLAAQLCSEFREFFPNNAVEYFVSYYDYYQPEAYVPGKDVYIEKDSAVNAEIDKLRHSATSALFERRDVIIVASVSCIFSLGDPEEYREQVLSLRPGMHFPREQLIKRLVGMQYSRSDIGFDRNNFRVRGDVVEIFPSNEDSAAVRVELFGDEIERISRINTVTGEVDARLLYAPVYPASHYVTSEQKRDKALRDWPSASPSLNRAASLSRRSASASACCSTSSRSAKSASATGWRTIPACWPDASRAASRIRCWTISRRIF